MEVIGWLTVMQLVKYYTILMVHRGAITNKAMNISSRWKTDYSYRISMSCSGVVRLVERFRYRGAHE